MTPNSSNNQAVNAAAFDFGGCLHFSL